MEILNKLKTKSTLVFLFLCVLFISVRVVGLGGDILNTDAERWHRRSEYFLEALKQGNYIETYQRYHPGVTLMWFNSIVKYTSFKYQLTYTDSPLTLEHADYFLLIHGISKAFNVLVLSGLLLLQLFFIKGLFDSKTAYIYGFLVSVEPYLIGINRWFHQTSFEVFFGFTAFLALLLWYKDSKFKHLVQSALFLTFAILAKVTSFILAPVLLIIFISKFIKDRKLVFRSALVYGSATIIFIFIFFPALWVDPLFVFNKIYGHIFAAVTDNIRADMITGLLSYFYYLVILLFKLSPITVILFVLAITSFRKTKDFNIKILIFSIFNYYVFLILTDQKIDRYSLVFFPVILLLSSVYLAKVSKKLLNTWLFLIFTFLIFTIYTYHPVYSAYYSPLFGGTKRALDIGIYDNSGEYFAQAALYLNTKGRNINTYVPDGFSSFNLYYKGNSQRDYTEETNYVVRSYDMQRLDPRDINCTTLDRSFGSKEHTIVYVWKCK